MLQRPEDGTESPPLTVHGWLVGVEMEEGVAFNQLSLKLADALSFVEGVGQVSVEYLGEIEIAPDAAVKES